MNTVDFNLTSACNAYGNPVSYLPFVTHMDKLEQTEPESVEEKHQRLREKYWEKALTALRWLQVF